MAYVQRLAKISKNVTAELLNRMIGMTFEGIDVESAANVLSVPKSEREAFTTRIRNLSPGSFYCLGPAISRERILVSVGRVLTTHPEMGTAAAASPPPAPEKIRALLSKLKDLPQEAETKIKVEADLKQEIRSLKAQLAARPSAPPPAPKPVSQHDLKIVEVPFMGKREMNKLEKLAAEVTKAQSHLGYTCQSLEIATRDMVATLERMKDGKSTNELRKASGLAPVKEVVAKVIAKVPRVFAAPVNGAIEGAPLSKCERGILTILAQYSEGCAIGKIALLAGYTRTSGSFINSLSSLRAQNYLKGANNETMTITGEGGAALGPFEPLPAGEALAAFWANHRAL